MAGKKKRPAPGGRRVPRGSRDAPTGAGPLTLEQALLLARTGDDSVAAPARAARAHWAHRERETSASPAAVGQERKRLERERQERDRRRQRDYADVMRLLQRRGVVRPGSAGGSGAAGAARPSAARRAAPVVRKPLRILAEGDSWFDYPVPLFGGAIVPRLEARLGVPILNLAKAGDEVRFMLGVRERELLRAHLAQGAPSGGAWDALLFSGGGNDIVGDPLALWIRDYESGAQPADLVHAARFSAALALVRAGYEDLLAVRDEVSPRAHVFLHAYDFAIPDGRGICHLGPWLKPSFDLRGFPDRTSAWRVVRVLLEGFARLLASLAQQHADVTVVATQGTLPSVPRAWHNELHPAKRGFDSMADLFARALRERFPDRLP